MAQAIKISDFIKKTGLPKNAKFVGYVVHLSDSDEFLSLYDESPDASGFVWAKIPDLAHVFDSFYKAENFVKIYGKDSVVALLFDLGDTYSLHLP